MVQIIAEIGINHNGSLKLAKKLIDVASVAGCDFVKFQKRTPDICVPEDQKTKEKKVPWKEEPITYLQYKYDIEFGKDEYDEIDRYCIGKEIDWFASVWDSQSAKFLSYFDKIVKIPSAKITDLELLDYCKNRFEYKIMSTGMSTEEEIEKAVEVLNPDVIMHTNSVYPTPVEDLYLDYIRWLKDKYPNKEIGFSNHYFGIIPLVAVTLLDIQWVEFHITMDRYEWGSDQLSSIEPSGVFKVVKDIRDLEVAKGKGYGKRDLYPGEDKKRESLRG